MVQSIITEVEHSIGMLTLNKAERHNACDAAMVGEMTAGLRELDADPQVRVVVLSSSGKTFCAGADPKAMNRALSTSADEASCEAHELALLMRTLNELGKPTIARVQGPAYGIGVGLIAACDIAVTSYDAWFRLNEVKLGAVPAVISPYLLAAIGARYCRRYLLSGERLSAPEAYRIGLVHEIVPDDEQLDQAIGEIIDNLLKNGPRAQAECKALMRLVSGQPIDTTTIDETVLCNTRVRLGAEGQEGLDAFFEKRKPNWRT